MLLSILIPSTHDRSEMLSKLLTEIIKQIVDCDAEDKVEIITDVDDYIQTTGFKRNSLMERSKAEYISYIDSDDWISGDYINDILLALNSEPDVVGFLGWMETDNNNRQGFKISKDLPYQTIKDESNNNFYLRYNNHLSPIKKSIALQIKFPDKTYAEDYDYAIRLKDSGLIKTEVFILKELYFYQYKSKK